MRALFSLNFVSKKLLLPLAEKTVFCILYQKYKKEAATGDEVTCFMLSIKCFYLQKIRLCFWLYLENNCPQGRYNLSPRLGANFVSFLDNAMVRIFHVSCKKLVIQNTEYSFLNVPLYACQPLYMILYNIYII